jgi:malto-oligosyltrehalose trehalohydrolase
VFLHDYAGAFFTERHHTPWGAAINFDGPQAAAVRAFYVQNALLWIQDYRFDGLRLDAVQAIKDESPVHILHELSAAVRTRTAGRQIHLMLENDLNEARWLGPDCGYTAQWNDDFHHVMRVLLADQTDGYFVDYATDPVEHLGRALTQGFSYQGQESKHRPGMFRGTASGHLPPTAFVNFLQNHDQVGNAPYGQRLSQLAPAEAVRLGTAVMLLSPGIPMLFMGEEWAASTPFDYFCDYPEPLAGIVREGRREEFRRFEAFQSDAALAGLSDPTSPDTMAHSKLDWAELETPGHADILALHARLLALRARFLWPLLDRIGGGAGRFRALSARAITAWWEAGSEYWIVAANFSPDPVRFEAPPGQTIFALGADQPDELSGWGFRALIGRAGPGS